MEWTKDQQKVIELRNRNILVSAAAGSGKTAVLVERIISIISEGESPQDIDRLLIVTFTNAAAAEMRERIGRAIEKKIAEIPDNLHLQKQMTLIHSAQITTIHSFCLYVIRNYFNTIDLDPTFRIGDEAELTLLESDVLGELLEEYYEEGKEEFLDFVENFASGKSDAGIEELILKLYHFSESYPWPEEWLEEKKNTFAIDSLEEMYNSDWMKVLLSHIEAAVRDMLLKCETAIRICKEEDGPLAYLAAIQSDHKLLEELAGQQDYGGYKKALDNLAFARLSGKKEAGVSEAKKNQVKALREEVKKAIGSLKKDYYFQPEEEMLADIRAMYKPMDMLLRITRDFSEAFSAKKEEKNLVDFGDLEHLALKILVQDSGEGRIPAPAADELSEHYYEILIDEYQDSNYVQEMILSSISGQRFSRPNLFMVGDVKQSIYKFRLARPELFMEKFESYDTTDSTHQRVDLHRNFRSREVVLNSINYIFEQIMTKKLGNIEYNQEAALYPGADYGERSKGVSTDTEVLLISVDPSEPEDESRKLYYEEENAGAGSEEEEYGAKELEAKAIAGRILELTDPDKGLDIYDNKKKMYRRAEYRDIVILLRTMSNWAEVFAETLTAEGIACHTDNQSGYFSTIEIRTLLDFLRIIDNPRQDIPFTAVLRSPIGGLGSNDLASVRIPRRKVSMYEAAREFAADYEEKDQEEEEGNPLEQYTWNLAGRLKRFLDKLEAYRDMVSYLSIHELILKVLDDTGYYNYLSAMPGGDKRRANMDMLVQRAIQFEAGSYRGLFHFVRYMEKLKKYDIDFGEARIGGENDNTVRIMSIHKSKGLEFPIVFAAGMGKAFNNQDSRSRLLIHPDFGLGPDYLDHQLRVKAPTLVKKVIQRELVTENLGEELRVLYVAMTRAKEKLILTGGTRKLEDKLAKWGNICVQEEKQLLYYQLSHAASCLDWIIPAVMRHRSFQGIMEEYGVTADPDNPLYAGDAQFSVRILDYEELAKAETLEQQLKNRNKEELLYWDQDRVYNEKVRKDMMEILEFRYPYRTETRIPAKLTVSELKKLGQMEAEELGDYLYPAKKGETQEQVPAFAKREQAAAGADLGTLYHRILEYLDLLAVTDKNTLWEAMEAMTESGRITPLEAEGVDMEKLKAFTVSPLADRMRAAHKSGRLHKESQFIMGMKANEINDSLKSEETVLVQGVIDVYFEEGEELVLVDYKTDKVNTENGREVLLARYKIQLDYYQKALEQLTGKRVKEKIIYSFALNETIFVAKSNIFV